MNKVTSIFSTDEKQDKKPKVVKLNTDQFNKIFPLYKKNERMANDWEKKHNELVKQAKKECEITHNELWESIYEETGLSRTKTWRINPTGLEVGVILIEESDDTPSIIKMLMGGGHF
jgi:hypothetical protein